MKIIPSDNQALDRSQPVLPVTPGVPERRSHDYVRHGTTGLFAAFNIADGSREVILGWKVGSGTALASTIAR